MTQIPFGCAPVYLKINNTLGDEKEQKDLWLYFVPNKTTGNVWIIGDTYRDVETAHANNAKCLAVMTGCHNEKIKQRLIDSKPDVLVQDLSDTEKIIEIII